MVLCINGISCSRHNMPSNQKLVIPTDDRLMKEDQELTSPLIRKKLLEETGLDLPLSTIRTLRREIGWVQCHEMKKTLSKGGIYHVVLTDKTKKLCLWNGVDLLLWTDMEIVLEASHIWVGSLKTVPLEEVRVKHDGVSFQIKCKQRFKDIESNVNS